MKVKITVGFPPSRWEDYKEIRIKAIKDVPQAFLEEVEWSKKQDEEFWVQRSENVTFAEVDGKVVGIVGFYQEEKKKQKHIMNIVGVYVLPEYRGKKIGYELLKTVINIIKKNNDIKVIQLGVVTTQEPAMKLYSSLGFVQVGNPKYMVKVGNTYYDEYLMQMYL